MVNGQTSRQDALKAILDYLRARKDALPEAPLMGGSARMSPEQLASIDMRDQVDPNAKPDEKIKQLLAGYDKIGAEPGGIEARLMTLETAVGSIIEAEQFAGDLGGIDLHALDVAPVGPDFVPGEPQTRLEQFKPILLPKRVIRWGLPTEAYTSGATIVLDPTDPAGTDNGEGNATVEAGWTLPTVTGTALNIPVTAIIPFAKAADGKNHVLGQPVQQWGEVTYNTTTHKLQQTTWYDWGLFRTTISDAQDITTAVDCTGV